MTKRKGLPLAKAFLQAKRCGAKARRNNNNPCKQPAMRNGRCRLHGGLSTGPKTLRGKNRAAKANFKHGHYTRDAMLERKFMKLMTGWKETSM